MGIEGPNRERNSADEARRQIDNQADNRADRQAPDKTVTSALASAVFAESED